jgi:hypothetical protein
MLVLTYYSEIFNQRALAGAIAQLWLLPCVIALALIPKGTSGWAQFGLLTVLLSWPSRKRDPFTCKSRLTHVQKPTRCKSAGVVETRTRYAHELCLLRCTSMILLPRYDDYNTNRWIACLFKQQELRTRISTDRVIYHYVSQMFCYS